MSASALEPAGTYVTSSVVGCSPDDRAYGCVSVASHREVWRARGSAMSVGHVLLVQALTPRVVSERIMLLTMFSRVCCVGTHAITLPIWCRRRRAQASGRKLALEGRGSMVPAVTVLAHLLTRASTDIEGARLELEVARHLVRVHTSGRRARRLGRHAWLAEPPSYFFVPSFTTPSYCTVYDIAPIALDRRVISWNCKKCCSTCHI